MARRQVKFEDASTSLMDRCRCNGGCGLHASRRSNEDPIAAPEVPDLYARYGKKDHQDFVGAGVMGRLDW